MRRWNKFTTSRQLNGRCRKCRQFNCQIAHSLKPSKLKRAYERIEETIATYTDAEKADMFIVGGPERVTS